MTTALLLALVVSARPVAAPVRGSVDAMNVTHDAAGVLVRFLGVPKAKAQAGLDGLAAQWPGLRIGFVKTQASSVAAVYVTEGTVTVQRLKDLAAACSKLEGAKNAAAFIHPGPRNDALELEAFWEFEKGVLAREKRLAWRDDATYAAWVRKKKTTGELTAAMWPTWPLSELAVSLGIPGRDFLERPMAVLDLAVDGYPRDVGDNLVRVVVALPDATLLEVRQLAETRGVSWSKVMQDALERTDSEQKLGAEVPAGGQAPWEGDGPHAAKSPPREVVLFFTRALFDKLDAQAGDESVSFSKVVELGWRQAHLYVDPKKQR
jgi:hypothetical protein